MGAGLGHLLPCLGRSEPDPSRLLGGPLVRALSSFLDVVSVGGLLFLAWIGHVCLPHVFGRFGSSDFPSQAILRKANVAGLASFPAIEFFIKRQHCRLERVLPSSGRPANWFSDRRSRSQGWQTFPTWTFGCGLSLAAVLAFSTRNPVRTARLRTMPNKPIELPPSGAQALVQLVRRG